MSYMNIRPKLKLAETVQMVVFGAETETETEFRSVSKPHYKKWAAAYILHDSKYSDEIRH